MEYKTIKELCDLVVDCPHSTPTWTEHGKIVIRNNNIKMEELILHRHHLQMMNILRSGLNELFPRQAILL